MNRIARFWNTVRYLRRSQIVGRIRHRFMRPQVDQRPAPARRAARAGAWITPAPRLVSLIGPSTLRFLNETRTIDATRWDDPSIPKLWRYNLHYFDELAAASDAQRDAWRRAFLIRWVRENVPGDGTAWEPYPTSLRIVNWIKWALAGNALGDELLQSLALQTRWLSQRLEFHLLGNHLFVNAKALVFAGLFFEGDEAQGWFERGLEILERESAEQILADGGQFELSPMYHALALEDVLDLLNLAATFPDMSYLRHQAFFLGLREKASGMRRWLAAMSHPDGDIAFFNDAAFDVAPRPVELEAYARRLGLAEWMALDVVTLLAASGYIRVGRAPMVAILDVGEIGPDYLPAHAHADTLSFELSVGDERVFVNSGTSLYEAGDERMRQRGTAAHNTVAIDGVDSSEVWSAFRVARRARPESLRIDRRSGERIVVECSHSGYRRLTPPSTHSRRWEFACNEMLVHDTLTPARAGASARYHLHPSVCIDAIDAVGRAVGLRLASGRRVEFFVERGHLRDEAASWHPQFGASQPARVLIVDLENGEGRVRARWG
jgi:uncharacterized heparinase superfamily protein